MVKRRAVAIERRRWPHQLIRYAVKKLAARGEVAVNVYPHRFRHTFACHLLDNGAPLDFIQGMQGSREGINVTVLRSVTRGTVGGN
ncbi:tyrosine-type recombinase/integrase [Paenibacillus cellulositrophicus]|uniref:tyrosine-type recombinase/integrase n=1 Tax=Paenibacillus cellulositrophicus TaxID=562959 RepID=UPI0020404213|nr:tyrosine-type recombinase/integrase [Paenibacillus cellulositrophicus]